MFLLFLVSLRLLSKVDDEILLRLLFLASIKVIMSFLILIQFMCCITLTDLSMMDHLCIPGMKSNSSCGCIIFNVFWNFACQYFIKNFSHLSLSEIFIRSFPFLLCHYPICHQDNTRFIELVW
jgi:hypothetical protein